MPSDANQPSTPKVVLVTGASRGIGRGLAEAAAREGYAVIVNYVASDELARAVVEGITQAGGRAMAVQADVSVAADAARLVAEAVDRFGRLDAVVNNAAIGRVLQLDALTPQDFEETLRVNLLSSFLVSQAAVPHMMEDGGRLIFLSSAAARIGGKVSAAYAASKAGIEGLMHYYAIYLRPQRITANAIAPALIESDMASGLHDSMLKQLPMGRLGRTEEVWPAVRMMLETEYMTGQTVHLNGGLVMT